MNIRGISTFSAVDPSVFFPSKLSLPKVQMLIVCLLGLAAYSNTLHVEFVFDDFGSIVGNNNIKGIANFLTLTSLSESRFVCDLSFALNYTLNGLNPVGYHVVNLSIHLITALLVYVNVRFLLQTPRVASDSRASGFASYIPFCVSLVFVAHPVQTQAVTYIVQRYTSLATLFYMLSIALYLLFRLGKEEGLSKKNRRYTYWHPLSQQCWRLKARRLHLPFPS